MNKEAKVVFVDWGYTLSGSLFWEHWRSPNHKHNAQFELVDKTLFGQMPRVLGDWMRGRLSAEEVLAIVSRSTGVNDQLLLSELELSCRQMRIFAPEVLDKFASLRKRGMKVVIATDNMDTFPRWTAPALGLNSIFDGILDSATLGFLKQDFDNHGKSLFFANYLLINGLSPHEALLIDDSEDKGGKISTFGINYIHIERLNGLLPAINNIMKDL